MSRVATIFLLGLLALALTPPAHAAAGDSISITGLPSAPFESNGTQESIPFNVEVTVGQGNCPGGSAQPFTVNLAAKIEGASGPGIKAEVNPSSFQVTIDATDTVRDSETYGPFPATLILTAEGLTQEVALRANVTASASTVNCTVAVQPAGFEPTTASTTVEFKPASGTNTSQSTEQPVPGFELPVLAVALVALALIVSRRNK